MFHTDIAFVSVLALILFINFTFELCFAKTLNSLHIGLLHSSTEVVSYGACTSIREHRRTDGQGHPSRPSGLKPALRHLGTRRLLAFTRALHLLEYCIYKSIAITIVLHLHLYCIYRNSALTRVLHLQEYCIY